MYCNLEINPLFRLWNVRSIPPAHPHQYTSVDCPQLWQICYRCRCRAIHIANSPQNDLYGSVPLHKILWGFSVSGVRQHLGAKTGERVAARDLQLHSTFSSCFSPLQRWNMSRMQAFLYKGTAHVSLRYHLSLPQVTPALEDAPWKSQQQKRNSQR